MQSITRLGVTGTPAELFGFERVFNDTSLAAAVNSLVSIINADLTTQIQLNASLAVLSSVTNSNLTTAIQLNGALAAVTNIITANITTAINLNGSLAITTNVVTANLSTAIQLLGSAVVLSTVTNASLTTAIQLFASIVCDAQGSVSFFPEAQVGCLVTVSGNLSTNILLLGNAFALSSILSSDLSTGISLFTTIQAISSVTANISTVIQLFSTLAVDSEVVLADLQVLAVPAHFEAFVTVISAMSAYLGSLQGRKYIIKQPGKAHSIFSVDQQSHKINTGSAPKIIKTKKEDFHGF